MKLHSAGKMLCLFLAALVLGVQAEAALAARSATSLRSQKPGRFAPIPPTPRQDSSGRSPRRIIAPFPTENAQVFTTGHFRVLWGSDYNPDDPDWSDADGNGLPAWVEILAESLETAHGIQSGLGFGVPYGMDVYYMDVYVANTGIRIYNHATGDYDITVELPVAYYAYAEIDRDHQRAYLVFNDDFSRHTDRETAVLRATAAHELFHAVQAVAYPWDDEILVPDERYAEERWWFESTAAWMEELCWPEVNDYVAYVGEVLSNPGLPLTHGDGVRDYGMAILAGHLWRRYGGADLWNAVFRNAFGLGLEPAIEAALSERGAPSFPDILAEFWSLAAHPEDAWPDGALYLAAASPGRFQSEAAPPLIASVAPVDAPGRYGAHLFRFPDMERPIQMILLETGPDARWRFGFSTGGEETARVYAPAAGSAAIRYAGEGTVYGAMVNVSGVEGQQPYRAAFGHPDGDVNGDGRVGLADAILVLQVMAGVRLDLFSASGIRMDGRVGVADAVHALRTASDGLSR